MHQMTEKTFNVTIRVAHDEGLSDNRATNAVLTELKEGIENLVFSIFVRSREGDEYEISVEGVEVY